MKNHWIPASALVWGFVLLLAVAAVLVAAQNSTYKPRDHILLNCGASGQVTDLDGRNWTGDAGSKYAPSLNGGGSAARQDPSAPSVPYSTARVFTSPYTYTFPLGAGRIFIRLHFYPATYSNHAASDAFFSVTSGHYTFLQNFSASLTADALNFAYFSLEFSVNVSTGGLNLTFTPSTTHANSYAFVNGIEIVSIPDFFSSASPMFVNGGDSFPFPIDPDQALQTVYRFNVGGQAISPVRDSGLFRSWDDDTPYIYGAAFGVSYSADPNVTIEYTAGVPNYIAPSNVYSTARSMGPNAQVNLRYNLSWILTVDAGFYYLVRLHFCEIQYPITKINQRAFDIYLNNLTAQEEADVIVWSGGIGIPVYKDYVVILSGSGQMDLWVALHPDTRSNPEYFDAILNGLEVFKLQNSNNSLAGLNPSPRPEPDVDPSRVDNKQNGNSKSKIFAIVGGVIGGFAVLLAGFCLIAMWKRQKKKKKGKDAASSDEPSAWMPLSVSGNAHSVTSAKTTTGTSASSLPSNLCRYFSIAEIRAATKDFDESLLLGVGGFGRVYRGEIDGGATKVAIKRGNPMSEQGVHEFQTEIEMLSKLRHRHLVSLIGYCEDNCEMILVYDYMAHGTLREHLYKTQKPPLPWKQRLEICIGAARGLHYLHTGAKYTIIHRDVKTTNILLDGKWVAKVSDFGLSKTGPTVDNTHVSTVVKGSFGYLDPEYFRRQQLTEKSDVYSFGVVLFEVLCARPALNPTLPKEQVSLAEWALHCQKKGILDQLVDPFLTGKIAPQCFKKFAETAEKCVADFGIERPSMGDVLWSLEFALQLQESAEESGSIIGISDDTTPFVLVGSKDPSDPLTGTSPATTTTTTISIGGRSISSEDSSVRLTPSAVFSQIMNPTGR
ncbi:unnamed protein product [Musa hybrid cultivar]